MPSELDLSRANHLSIRLSAGFNAESMLAGLLAVAELDDMMAPLFFRQVFPTLTEKGYGLTLTRARVSEIQGWRAQITLSEEPTHGHHHHHSLIDILSFYDEEAKLSEKALDAVEKIWLTLAKAEGAVHGAAPESVHFHEVGRLSNRIAIALIATLLERLGVTLSASPIPVAEGVIECAHGFVANPAPATLAMLPGLPVIPFAGTGEAITPTGLAILIGLGVKFGPWPEMTVLRQEVAYTRQVFEGVPNGARFILGELAQE